ncbi:MAG: TIGR03790 family protein [Candidatus Methylacidiphilales bacterium]|nr:TIGR03790 family protein [Candidatus Methylacidiphilales bacterium]
MRFFPAGLCRAALLFWGLAGLCPLTAADLHDKLLVVFNSSDPDSTALAAEYARLRQIPADHILGLPASTNETITRKEFDQTLRNPISRFLESNQWLQRQPRKIRFNNEDFPTQQAVGNQIWAIALIRGIPLRIEGDPTIIAPESIKEPLRSNAAAVDSELSLLTLGSYPLSSAIPNPYFHSDRSREFNQFMADNLILVTRLDGPTPDDVRRMMRDSVATEEMELAGRAFFDSRNLRDPANPYTAGDDWIRQAFTVCRNGGFNAELDEAEPVYDDKQPWEDVALYAGWYERDVRGPFTVPGFRFAPGAVAYHLHSFSGESLRVPDRFWAGPLIHRGAAATMGNVYEPYLGMTPQVGIFFRGLLEGLTFAEAAYQSQVGLSWMTTFVGDPLYRPFPRSFLNSLQIAEGRQDRSSDWIVARTLRLLAQQPGEDLEKITTLIRAAESRPCPVVWEECADLVRDLGATTDVVRACYDKARQEGTSPITNIRLGLKIAGQFQKSEQPGEAMRLYEELVERYPKESVRYAVPQTALAYARKIGWDRLSPAMKAHQATMESTPPSTPASTPSLTSSTPTYTPPPPPPVAPSSAHPAATPRFPGSPPPAPSNTPPPAPNSMPSSLAPPSTPSQKFKPAIP